MRLNNTRTVTASGLVLTLVALASLTFAQGEASKPAVIRPADLQFVTMHNGTRQANVVGDITNNGSYAVRTKLPAGLRIPPHSHPEARIVLVMSGTLWVGFGQTFDDSALTALPPGSVFTEPGGEAHFTWAKDGDVIVHVTGQGPTGTTWVNPVK